MQSQASSPRQNITGWRLNVVIIVFTIGLTNLVVAMVGWLLLGRTNADSMKVSTVSGLIIATLVVSVAGSIRARIAKAHRKNLEQGIERAQSHLRLAVESSEMLLWEFDLVSGELKYDHTSLLVQGLPGNTGANTIDEWMRLVHPDDRGPFRQQFQAALAEGAPTFKFDYRLQQDNGGWLWVNTQGRVTQRDAQGLPLLAVGGTINIDEHKRAQAKLQESEALLRATLASTDEGILMVGEDGLVLSANQRFIEMWRVPEELVTTGRDELLMARVLEQLSDPQAFASEVKRLYGSAEQARDTLQFKDGRVFTRFTRALEFAGQQGRIWCFKDVTEESRAQAALATSLDLFRAVIDHAPLRIFWKDLNLRYLGCNPIFAHDAGLNSEADLIHKSDHELSWRDQAEAYTADDRAVMNSGVAKLLFDEQQTTPDGRSIWLRTSKVPLHNRNHELIGVLGMYEDVTHIKLGEVTLALSEEKFRKAFELTPDATNINRLKDGMYVSINDGFTALMGYSREEIIGHTSLEFDIWQHPEDRLRLVEALKQDGKVSNLEAGFRDKQGQIHFAAMSAAVIDIEGEAHIISVSRDMTERKKAEEKLRQLSTAIEQSPASVVITDLEANILYVNPRFTEVTGYAAAEVLGKNPRILQSQRTPKATFEALWQTLVNGKPWRGELVNQRKNGEIYWEDAQIAPVQDSNGKVTHYVALKTDVTERKAHQIELERAKAEAEAANLAKSRFLATMSHEIRTPMNGILGMAQLLMMPDLTDTERNSYVRTILSSGHTLMSLLNDLLDLSKIEAGKLHIDAVVFDPSSLLQEVQTLFTGAVQVKHLGLDSQWVGPSQQRYRADVHRLRQMLSNLLGNAVKFTQQGSVRIDAREMERDQGGHATMAMLEFSVTDTGIGVAADKLDLLFKPFSQTDSSITREFGGSGLGLAIVRRLAKAMGGDVGVQSEAGKGSRFWFRIKAGVVGADEHKHQTRRGAGASTPALPEQNQLTGHVLVVEDNPVNCLVITSLLSGLGLTHVTVHDGQQAVETLTQQAPGELGHRFDLVLMDLHMPVMDGYTATRKIREWEKDTACQHTPIVALTADAFEEDRQHCLAVGMDDFVTKPIALNALKLALAKWLTHATQASTANNVPLKARDMQAFAALFEELVPLLAQNKFNAIRCFMKLQDLVAGTSLAEDVEAMDAPMQNLRFDLALAQLHAMADKHVAPHDYGAA